MADRRRRALVPERLLLPPPPQDPRLRERFEALPFERRRELARASQDPAAGPAGDEARLVVGLAEARVASRWRPQAAAVVLGWLMLMTLWGFGQSTYPDSEPAWLAAGLVAGGIVWLVAARAAARRVGRARAVVDGSR
jgi:hypothetical protein